ncbi:fumarylacetoacetate hydrolase family protein [Paludibacterium purpuratum]|uniref:2-keto-4-pentenoate hydratase/2-oxohepta-3-ene-1,7-dioic acid hydratase in catechol pathway n=1 Tax=Paludibacterium purpuratum TaxID=1144873 RepID=A0A4R7BAX3_9NEIS|nr:fumarylacetoacetate hydrolase family protein [Paludibacterium purpuratum]TDR82110.1 2-keto-4-pentenoate hydratase/2-oxohepta-3-ene-1,7-dioic acid hydratase in catechol pathway [Paludibacterium purpuratum]
MKQVKLEGRPVAVATIFCVGRNYAAHIAELNNVRDDLPLVFLKPQSALLGPGGRLTLPKYSHDVHHECELVLLIGRDADHLPVEQALDAVAGYGVGLDLTARDIQGELKAKGHPWTRAKGFRGSACVSDFVAASRVPDPARLRFSLSVGDDVRQRGDSAMMLHGVAELVSWLSAEYGLQAGDLIYTGTPEGVGPIHAGAHLVAELDGLVSAQWDVVR